MSGIKNITYRSQRPEGALVDFVENFWYLHHASAVPASFTILPDGYFDVLYWSTDGQHFHASIYGLATRPTEVVVPGHCTTYAISFRLPALDYLIQADIASLVDQVAPFPTLSWQLTSAAAADFDAFVAYFTLRLEALLAKARAIDGRKLALFEQLYASRGAVTVAALSAGVHWGVRQLNRYFTSRAGMSLKAYCNILRYRASFDQLQAGTLYPHEDYYDQAHFIRDVKKYSGVTPKQLASNKNDRFIQLSTLAKR